jgi:SH3-like domain-containing protein
VICTLNKGAKVEVVKEFFEWYKVRLPAKAPSYLKKRFVACLDQTAEGVCRSARVISNRVNVRLSPNETSAILGKVNKTDAVTILGEEKGWYRIEPVAGSFGWIHKKFIKVSEAPAEAGPIEEGKVGQ